MLGHTKTVLVLLISWLALGEAMSARKAAGMVVAVAGMVGYGFCVSTPIGSSNSSSNAKSRSSSTSKPDGLGAPDALVLGEQQLGLMAVAGGSRNGGALGAATTAAAGSCKVEAERLLKILDVSSEQDKVVCRVCDGGGSVL